MIENGGIHSNVFWVQKDQQGDTILLTNGQMIFDHIYSSGTGVNQINKFYNLITGIASGSSIQIDLTSLNNILFGESFNFSLDGGKVKTLCIENLATGSTENASIRFSGSNAFTSPFGGNTTIQLAPQSNFLISSKNGWSVSSTQRLINIIDISNTAPQIEVTVLGSI